MGTLAIADALTAPTKTMTLRGIPAPSRVVAAAVSGRAGEFFQHGRRLIYLKRGRRVCWFEWREAQLTLWKE